MMYKAQRNRLFNEQQNEGIQMKKRANELARENRPMTLLKAVNCILDLAEDSEMSEEFWVASKPFANYVAQRMKISSTQAVLLALLVEAGSVGRTGAISDIARYTNCRNVKMLQYHHDLEELVEKGCLRKTKKGFNKETNYIIPTALIDAMNKNEAYEKPSYVCSNVMELFQKFYELTHLRFEEEMSRELLLEEVQELIQKNKKITFVKELLKLHLEEDDELVVMHFCRHLVLHNEDSLNIERIAYLYEENWERYNFTRSMADGTHPLIVVGLVENAFDGGFHSTKEYRMTDAARKQLLKGIELKLDENSPCDLILSKKIVKKDLFFAKDVDAHMQRLTQLLDEKEYQKICARLKKGGFREGFTCLFYGAPGTGKTESVMQLARLSGRDVMQVNISDVKSKWVGESEKNIKGIFDRYRNVVNNSKKMPILLFNEADAIINKRQEGAERAVDKMENSIQNIILQEMENLKGIMIATTNLEENMDKSFERRFLYKVKFDKPDYEQRAHIWQSMMPTLDKDTLSRLAANYNFSGGQIENIARKYSVDCILYGKRSIRQDTIEKYCQEETLGQKTAKIGFVK